jgi:hypothetical protein
MMLRVRCGFVDRNEGDHRTDGFAMMPTPGHAFSIALSMAVRCGVPGCYNDVGREYGWVAERFKAPVLKTGVRATVP